MKYLIEYGLRLTPNQESTINNIFKKFMFMADSININKPHFIDAEEKKFYIKDNKLRLIIAIELNRSIKEITYEISGDFIENKLGIELSIQTPSLSHITKDMIIKILSDEKDEIKITIIHEFTHSIDPKITQKIRGVYFSPFFDYDLYKKSPIELTADFTAYGYLIINKILEKEKHEDIDGLNIIKNWDEIKTLLKDYKYLTFIEQNPRLKKKFLNYLYKLYTHKKP